MEHARGAGTGVLGTPWGLAPSRGLLDCLFQRHGEVMGAKRSLWNCSGDLVGSSGDRINWTRRRIR